MPLVGFAVADLDTIGTLVETSLTAGLDGDWTAPAGSLEWSCATTLDHTVDCVFSYALFLASARLDRYPPFGELHALAHATPEDLVNGLHAVNTMLSAVIRTAEPDARAILFGRPLATSGSPDDFAARGAHEEILHAHDICAGLGLSFDPPRAECARLLDHTRAWPAFPAFESSGDPWTDLLRRSGR
jgi:hypothetical protein